MTGKKYEKALGLDMDFDEALKRFAKTDPGQLEQAKAKKVRSKPKATPARSQSTSRDNP